MSEEIRVLLVDDNVDFTKSMADVLLISGYRVVTANSGREALQMMDSDAFDVVLLDVSMPEMDGITTFRHMRKRVPGTHVILMTAFAGKALEEVVIKEGVFAMLGKPASPDVVFDTINRAARGD